MTHQPTDLDSKVSNLVRVLRAQNGLSVEAMASYLSVSPQDYENMENGRTPFTVEHLVVLARVLRPVQTITCPDIEFFQQYMALSDQGKRFVRAALKTQSRASRM